MYFAGVIMNKGIAQSGKHLSEDHKSESQASCNDHLPPLPFLHDVTELPELDSFFCPKGPLLEAKTLAAELFRAKETWFLVGGTSCGVQAAIMGLLVHREILSSCRETPMFLPLQVKLAIAEANVLRGRKMAAVFVTSPNYNGICSNLSEISKVCHSQGIPLIVDEAHGAHFKFHPEMPKTALDQGADVSIQSTHKVLCSFLQSSMLHISGEMIDRERLHKCLHALQSTSPSWLFLASLDAARHQLSTDDTAFNDTVNLANEAKTLIRKIPGISVLDLSAFPDFSDIDPLRVTVGVWQLGLSGFQANEILDKDFGIIPELVSTNSVTLAFSQGTTIAGKAPYDDPFMSLNPREAFFASKMRMKFKDCCGEVCGEVICPFPPGVPVLAPGEVITEKALDYLQEIGGRGGYIIGAADALLDTIIVCKR
ncbi:Arginine decarboxylase [Sesamum alatum]|uniref:Arginine decarboxylase n=1 Tax=Sesamum alatum TaxID=300844 RepID=A0AAE1YLP0_9LAMI|nr:Arginine decarboxylase [Sesamum alatum]